MPALNDFAPDADPLSVVKIKMVSAASSSSRKKARRSPTRWSKWVMAPWNPGLPFFPRYMAMNSSGA